MEDGAIIHVDYDLFSGETGDLIETTREEIAKEYEMHQEGRNYSPMVCIVGTGNLIAGFEAALKDAKVGKEVCDCLLVWECLFKLGELCLYYRFNSNKEFFCCVAKRSNK